MHFPATNTPDLADRSLRKALRRNNLPLASSRQRSFPERVIRSRWTWITIILLAIELLCGWMLYQTVVPDRQVPGGTLIGLGTEAVGMSARYAAITVIPLTLLFLWADRFRPQRFWIWLVTFGWGALVATLISLWLNTAAAAAMHVEGDGNPAAAARPAVFIAPFVEEAAKATILFFLAIAMRYRWVSKLSGIALAGISAAAFAFTENILYYGRAYRAAAQTTGAGTPDELLQEIFLLRGVLTFFGHPLFTCLTGIGLAVAIRSRSKLVRVLAPAVGFLAAALLHMLFNGVSSSGVPVQMLLIPLIFVAYPMVISLIIYTVRQVLAEKKLIMNRLSDYHRMGWLPESDVKWLPRLRTRVRVLWQALWQGDFLPTLSMQRTLTELAYLRDSIARGIVDEAGLVREKQLLHKARSLRGRALVEPLLKTHYPWQRFRFTPVEDWAPPTYPGPAGIGGNYPAVTADVAGSAPLGSSATQYSPVDPRWKPPGS